MQCKQEIQHLYSDNIQVVNKHDESNISQFVRAILNEKNIKMPSGIIRVNGTVSKMSDDAWLNITRDIPRVIVASSIEFLNFMPPCLSDIIVIYT
jgi:hypothetical protein